MDKVKLFISDIDGTLTDSTVYYSTKGEELKQFSFRDGMGFRLLKEKYNCQTALITSGTDSINKARAKKFDKLKTIDYFIDGNKKIKGVKYFNKLLFVKLLCTGYCNLSEVAYIGDDTNDLNCLESVGFPACPNDAHKTIKKVNNIFITELNGGKGAVREFIDYLIENDFCYK